MEVSVLNGYDAIIIEVWLESPSPKNPLSLDEASVVGKLRQVGGGTVWILSRGGRLPWDPRQRFAQLIKDARDAAMKDQGWTGDPPLSICLHDPNVPNQNLILCELAVLPPEANETLANGSS